MAQDKLERLEEDKLKIEAQIYQERTRQNSKKRKQDTRRKILIGAFCLSLLEQGKSINIKDKDELYEMMNNYLSNENDRQLFK